MYRLIAICFAAALSVCASATPISDSVSQPRSERPLIGPPAAWVIPASVPEAPPAAQGAATITLLADTQMRLGDAGDTTYSNSVYKIATPQGLDDGYLQVAWDPALETVTLHRYRLIRDGKPIDLLGDGSRLTVVRRETNLERATLDGELTATLQPEDLRVGDVIDLAYSVTRKDPAAADHSGVIAGPPDGVPFGRNRIRVLWPATRHMRWRAQPGVVQPRLGHVGADSELLSDLTNITPPRPPERAPLRYRAVNAVEVSDFADWAAVSHIFAPLYDKAAQLGQDSPLKGEIARIRAAAPDSKTRAALALKLVQEQVRYLFLGMDDGGFVPASADLTWSRRYGDCKGKTVLLVALLNGLGIDARAALVNTEQGDYVATRLPTMNAFNHAIVEARIDGRSYWLDGTRIGDQSLDRVRVPAYHVALPVTAVGADLVALNPEPLLRPSETVSLALDASAGIDVPAPARGEMRFRGESASEMRQKFADLAPADRDTALRKQWRDTYNFITLLGVGTSEDPATGDFLLTMTGTAKMAWIAEAGTRWYEVDRARLGWNLDITREAGINKDAPFAFNYPDWWASSETMKLPNNGEGFRLQGGDVEKTVAGLYAFHRAVRIEAGIMTMEVSTRSLADQLPIERAEEAHSQMADLAQTAIFVRVPDDYRPTDGDIAALKENKPALIQAYIRRGALSIDRGQLDAGLADEDAALALDPDNAFAHSLRALALATKGDARADAAADRALVLDPKRELAWLAKGVLATLKARFADADNDFSKAIELNDRNERYYAGRGGARAGLGRFAEALVDVDKALAINPNLPIRSVRAAALWGLGRMIEATAEADIAVGNQPKAVEPRYIRAQIRAANGQRNEARADLDILIAAKPKAEYYVKRAILWDAADKARRLADLDEAVRLDPRSTRALAIRASYALDAGNLDRAEADISAAEKLKPGARELALLRSSLLVRRGHPQEGLAVIDAIVAKNPTDSMAFNERCWMKATMRVSLDTALSDCQQALKLAPNSPAILDSRAFTQLRLGHFEAAIEDYDAALKFVPNQAASLFGRGLALIGKGERDRGMADIAAARRLSPEIDARFASFGMAAPPAT
ncbi:Tfp pilus assembly protein PilF [Sphingomonas sp. YR710]|uniref:DUF3857 domain-containing protein n=1 Tax=Sphingomonas sp. YR710 TaxID=1882773 RepID=UPI000881E624|nr:DUF3857 domain-containing protein [Sphingomonas sp. YR710]SDD22748.1 Tfp pilus assembly protein PilF [Sphingomonas sp. YR710]